MILLAVQQALQLVLRTVYSTTVITFPDETTEPIDRTERVHVI